MTIRDFSIYRYQLPFRTPVIMGGQEHKTREGAFIRLTGENETLASWGEIAPLPGFSRESLRDAVAQLQLLRTAIKDCDIPDTNELIRLDGAFETWLDSYQLFPSVRFGLETAVLQLVSRQRKTPLRNLISSKAIDKVLVCALLSGTNEVILEKAATIRTDGFKTAKLKVGRQTIEDDITLVRAVREKTGTPIALRLDANRAWNVEQATTFMDGVKDCNIEYIEEPTQDYLGILQLCNRAKNSIPIALDESLGSVTTLDQLPGVEAIVLKPTMLGLERTVQLARRAAKLGMKAIESSSFESGLGLLTLAELAATLKGAHSTPAGLDTGKFLAGDVLPAPLTITRGRIDLTAGPARDPQPKLDLLEQVNDV